MFFKTISIIISMRTILNQIVQFPQGSMSLLLGNQLVGTNNTQLTLSFNISSQLPSQINIEIIFPVQIPGQQNFKCGVSASNSQCLYLNGKFQITYPSPSQVFQVIFLQFQNPISNFSQPILISCKNSSSSEILLSLQFSLSYTLLAMDVIQFKLQNSIALTQQNLTLLFTLSQTVPQGGYLLLQFPQLNLGGSIPSYPISQGTQCLPLQGFDQSLNCLTNGKNLSIHSNYGLQLYSLIITLFTTPYAIDTDQIVLVFMMDINNNFIAQGQQIYSVMLPLSNIALQISSSQQKIRSTTDLTFKVFPQQFIQPNSSLQIQYQNAVSMSLKNLKINILIDGQSSSYQTDYTLTNLQQSSQIFIQNAFPQYVQNKSFSISLQNILNQNDADTVEFFTISLMNSNNNLSQAGNVSYQATPENIKNMTIIRSNDNVKSIANYSFFIEPCDQIINQGMILLKIPQQLSLQQSSLCQNTLNIGSNFSCSFYNKTLNISGIFQQLKGILQFDLTNVINPIDTIKTDAFTISIYENNKLISQDLNINILTFQPYQLKIYTTVNQLQQTNSIGTLQLIIQNTLNLSLNDSLIIVIPLQLSFNSQNFSCQVLGVDISSTRCVRNNSTLLITGFSIQQSNMTIEMSNLQFERSLIPTDRFIAVIQNQNFEIIASGSGGSLQLSQVPELLIKITTVNYLLGVNNTWDIDIFLNNVALQPNDTLILQIPRDIQVQDQQCYQIQPSQKIIQCSYNQTLQNISMPIDQNVAAETKISYKIVNLINPQVESNSLMWNLMLLDQSGFLIATGKFQSQTWMMRNFPKAYLKISNPLLGMSTNLTLEFENQKSIPSGGMLKIYFNQTYFNLLELTNCFVDNQYLKCQKYSQYILLTFLSDLIQGQHNMVLKNINLQNASTIPKSNILTVSYQLASYDQNNEQLEGGDFKNQIQYLCQNNCTTCSNIYSNCTSCDNQLYLQQDKCVTNCNIDQVVRKGKCQRCMTNITSCQSCSNVSLTTCTKCQNLYSLIYGVCQPDPKSFVRSELSSFQVIDSNYVLTAIFFVILGATLIKKCFSDHTRAITLFYGCLVLVQNALEMAVVVNLFASKQQEFGLASLSLVVMHLVSQIYSITQISITLKTDPVYYTYKRQSNLIKLVHLIANLFCYRSILLMLSKLTKSPQWDAQWMHRTTILDQLCILLKICILYSLSFFALSLTYIILNKNQKIQLFYLELLLFSLILLMLDSYHLWFVNQQLKNTLRQKDSDRTFDPVSQVRDLELGHQKLCQENPEKISIIMPDVQEQQQKIQNTT